MTDMQVNAKCLYEVKVNKLYNSHKLLSLMSSHPAKKAKISECGILLLCLYCMFFFSLIHSSFFFHFFTRNSTFNIGKG